MRDPGRRLSAEGEDDGEKAGKKETKANNAMLPVMRPDAAGIDIGATEIFVAVPADRAAENVRSFPTFTQDLYALADWLKQCGIKTVAMESTGVYWIPLFQILEDRGFEVCLVNARHVKNVPGRRTDVSDCQWLQFLHSVGLLRASYRPEQEVCAVRSLLRHRESLVQMAATHVNHMQKALDQMNLQLHHVISDITGQTGLAIVDAILAGQRDPFVLAKLRNERIKASEEVIAKSLVGDYRHEHLFTLRQSLAAYRSYQKLIDDCDREIRRSPGGVQATRPPRRLRERQPEDAKAKTAVHGRSLGVGTEARLRSRSDQDPWHPDRYRSNAVRRDRPRLHEVPQRFGVRLLDGVMPGQRHQRRQSSLGRHAQGEVPSRHALRMAAQSLHHSKSALGDFYRRMRAKLGAPKAITAAAHKLARIIFHLITTRQEFDDSKFAADQLRYQKKQEGKLRAKAKAMGFELVPLEQAR